MTIVFQVIKHTIGLRASREEEVRGLDVTEHNLTSSYADFMPMPPEILTGKSTASPVASMEKAVEVKHYPVSESGTPASTETGAKLTKVVILFNQDKFIELKDAMNAIGVTGMTVIHVMGCGVQKGNTRYYRGVKLDDIVLLPKIKLEIVVSKVPVQTVVDTARKVLYTGNIGDGKIFIYDVENVIKVRTGAEGYYALQDDDEA